MELWLLWIMITLPSGQVLVHEGNHEFSSSQKCAAFGQPMADILATIFPTVQIELFCRIKDQQKV